MKKLMCKEANAFEDFCTNLDVLRNIFDLLKPKDQLRFAVVTPQLSFVLRNYIWCTNFKTLEINKCSWTIRLINFNMDFELSLQEFEYFLQIYGEDVEEFIEKHGSALPIYMFLPNLVSIKYYYLLFTTEHMRLIGETCHKLETLLVHSCCNKKRKSICFGSDIEFEPLMQLKNLKNFTLTLGSHRELNYCFKNSYLKKLKIPMETNNSLESLNIYMPSLNTSMWLMFPNLKNLTISIVQSITAEEIKALAYACPQLKQLTLSRCRFNEVDNFAGFKNLTDLSLYHCQGLTYDNLKEILIKLNLQTFTSINTKYTGIFHYYFVTPSIKSIFIDSIKTYKFMSESEYYTRKAINCSQII